MKHHLYSLHNLRQLIELFRREKEIVDIYEPVDPNLEIAEIHRCVAAADGPALFFHNVKGSNFPVVTNLFGSHRRVALCFGPHPEKILGGLISLMHNPSAKGLWKSRSLLARARHAGTKKVRQGHIKEHQMNPVDMQKLPMLKSWPEDGGHFVTLPLVYTEPAGGGPANLGMYRIQRFNSRQAGLHFQIGKGAGFHYKSAEEANQNLDVNIFIGGAPALILSAIAPLPENLSELLIAGFLQKGRIHVTNCPENDYPLIAECEFALVGKSPPHKRRLEGPFGDHYGYYSLAHEFPYFECEAIYHRKRAIYPATVVGKPFQEDYYIGDYLQKLLSPLFPLVMPAIKSLWSYGATGYHSLSAAVVNERYARESITSAFRILGEGQLSLTKFLLITDQSVDLQNFTLVLQTILERLDPRKDLFIFSNLCLDTLDYTGPKLNEGSRGVMVGVGPKVRNLCQEAPSQLPDAIKRAALFCPGCLVCEAPPYSQQPDLKKHLEHPDFSRYPLVVFVDDLSKALKNEASFMWTVFTRFEPAADIFGRDPEVVRHHICYHFPICIDARMKPSYPDELVADDATRLLVKERWSKYFSKPVEMGDSINAHI